MCEVTLLMIDIVYRDNQLSPKDNLCNLNKLGIDYEQENNVFLKQLQIIDNT